VIAGNNQHGSNLCEVEKSTPHDLFRRWSRRSRVEDVAGYQGQIDPVLGCQSDQLVEDGAMLLGPIAAANPPSDMPIGCV
jgi:hypothetical protein